MKKANGLCVVVIALGCAIMGCASQYKIVDGKLIINEGVTSIKDEKFWDRNLTSVTIPDSVTSIGRSAFRWNKLTSVTIPNSVTSIGDSAFMFNHLTSVTIPNSVTSIGHYAFANNYFLTSVTIPDSVTAFNNDVFSVDGIYTTRKLTQISIGANVAITGLYPLPYNFEAYYKSNNLKAGTYTYSNGNWNFQPR